MTTVGAFSTPLRRVGNTETSTVTLVEPRLVVEVDVDVARDRADRWRYAARWHCAQVRRLTRNRSAHTRAGRGAHRLVLPGVIAEVCRAPNRVVRCDRLRFRDFSELRAGPSQSL